MNAEYEALENEVRRKKEKITKQKEKLAFFNDVFDNTVDIYWQLDLQGNYTEGLGGYIELFGYTRDEILSMNFRELIDEHDLPELEKLFLKILSDKKVQVFEMRANKRDHTPVQLEARSWPLIENGKIVGTCGIARDITARKNAEKKLKDQKEKYRRIAANTNDLIWIWNLEKRAHDFISSSLIDLTGYTVEENPLRTIKKNIVQEDQKKLFDLFLRTPDDYGNGIGKGKYSDTERIEWREFHKDGHILWVEAVISVLRDENGKALQILGISRDITQLKELEIELKKGNVFIETILDNLPIAIAVYKMSDGKKTYVNARNEEVVGWKNEDIVSVDDFFEMCLPNQAYRQQVRKQMLSDIYSGDISRLKWDNIPIATKLGEKRIVNIQVIPLLKQDLLIATVKDVTSQKKLEEQLRQARKMESIATLAGGIAHQFNNALSVLTGYLGIMKLESPGVQFITNYVGPMENSINRMSRLTEQLLAYARGGKYHPEKIALTKIAQSTLSHYENSLGTGISLQTGADCEDVVVEVDQTQIRAALSAILINAIESIEKDGAITVSCKKASITGDANGYSGAAETNDFACLTITDTGTGMDEQTRARIFEPFFTTKVHGRGLGLAAVYGIMKNHDGWVDVSSDPGKGTTVRLFLPAA